MKQSGFSQPTDEEWANAEVMLIKKGDPLILGLRKELRKDGVPYCQTMWMTPAQLRGLALDNF